VKLFIAAIGRQIVSLPAEAALEQIRAEMSRHEQLALRHPVAAYNVSVAAVADRLDNVLHLLPLVLSDAARDSDLLRAYEALLQALREHIEACRGILKSLVPDPAKFRKNPHVRRFDGAAREYSGQVGMLSGRLRHQGRRLVLMTAVLAGTRFGGYFVEAPLPRNTVGPDPEIHSEGLTAFSFNRDLKFHACNLLLISERLRMAVGALCGLAGMETCQKTAAHRLADAVEQIAALSDIYFPDEYERQRPVLSFFGENAEARLHVEFVSSAGWRPYAGQRFEVSLRYTGDGVTSKWKVPYTQKEYRPRPRPASPLTAGQPSRSLV
jgi:hypothetical protein